MFTFVAFSMFSISVTQISFAIGTLAWLLKVHLTRAWKDQRGTIVGIAILYFSFACLLSLTTAVDFENSIKILKKLLQFLIFFWVANAVQDRKQRDLLAGLVIVAGTVAALSGILPSLNPAFFLPEMFHGNRPIGTLSMPATFGGILMIAGLVSLGRFLYHKPKAYSMLGATGVIVFCLILTLTRQAWLGFFIGTVFLIFFWNKKYLLILPLLLASIVLFAPDKISDRVNSLTNLTDNSLQLRISLWKVGWKIFKDHPVTGCGYKCVDAIHSQYSGPTEYVAKSPGMHSNIFQLMVDTGLVGLGLWLSIWASYFFEILKRYRALDEETSHNNTKAVLMGSSAAVLAYLIGGLFESSIYDSEVSMLIYFLVGLSLTNVTRKKMDVQGQN